MRYSGIDSYTKLLLHGDKVDGSISHLATFAGTARLNVGGSCLLDGNGDWLTVPDSDDFNFGSGDFTIDCWVRFTNVTAVSDTMISQWYTAGNNSWIFQYDGYGTLYFLYTTDGSTLKVAAASWSPSINIWYHTAVVRYGNDLLFFVDGSQVGTTVNFTGITLFNSSDVMRVGSNSGNSFSGYIDELRISKGIARWTSNFAPQTTPYITDSYTKLLLHCDGFDGGVVFIDDTGKTVTTVGTTQIDTAQYKISAAKFGSTALLLDGNSDYLSFPDSDNWSFGTGDFTIDCWVRFASTAGVQVLCGQDVSVNDRWYISFITNTIYLYFVSGETVKAYYSAPFAPTLNTWYHLAVARSSTTAKMFINGSQPTLTTVTAFSTNDVGNVASVLSVGSLGAAYYFNGWIDEYRISKGIARWTSNFAPLSKKYISDKYTCLLCHFDGTDAAVATDDCSGGDESGNNKIVTYVGTAQTDTAQSKFGGSSLLLDGNSDYLTLADSDDWNFGTGQFTIESWVKFNGTGVHSIFEQYVSTPAQVSFFYDNSTTPYFEFYIVSGGVYTIAFGCGVTLTVGNWYHVALERIDNTNASSAWRIFVNGVSQTLSLWDGAWNASYPDIAGTLYVGSSHNSGSYLNGWIDEYRISKGIARWTSNFDVPLYPYKKFTDVPKIVTIS